MKLNQGDEALLIIDEIQKIDNWSEFVKKIMQQLSRIGKLKQIADIAAVKRWSKIFTLSVEKFSTTFSEQSLNVEPTICFTFPSCKSIQGRNSIIYSPLFAELRGH